jgi:hypothetical protein
MEADESRLTPREKLLKAIQTFADAWKSGNSDSVKDGKSALWQALDAYEFNAEALASKRLVGK